jgi:hypothetical protein
MLDRQSIFWRLSSARTFQDLPRAGILMLFSLVNIHLLDQDLELCSSFTRLTFAFPVLSY